MSSSRQGDVRRVLSEIEESPVLWEQGASSQGIWPAASVLSEEGGQHKATMSRPDHGGTTPRSMCWEGRTQNSCHGLRARPPLKAGNLLLHLDLTSVFLIGPPMGGSLLCESRKATFVLS